MKIMLGYSLTQVWGKSLRRMISFVRDGAFWTDWMNKINSVGWCVGYVYIAKVSFSVESIVICTQRWKGSEWDLSEREWRCTYVGR
jgi:hypothetical protein